MPHPDFYDRKTGMLYCSKECAKRDGADLRRVEALYEGDLDELALKHEGERRAQAHFGALCDCENEYNYF